MTKAPHRLAVRIDKALSTPTPAKMTKNTLDLVARVTMAVAAELDAMQARIDALEGAIKSGRLEYVGVWQEGAEYERGNFCTHSGSVWHCNASTRAKPGESPDWTLAVKRGKTTRLPAGAPR